MQRTRTHARARAHTHTHTHSQFKYMSSTEPSKSSKLLSSEFSSAVFFSSTHFFSLKWKHDKLGIWSSRAVLCPYHTSLVCIEFYLTPSFIMLLCLFVCSTRLLFYTFVLSSYAAFVCLFIYLFISGASRVTDFEISFHNVKQFYTKTSRKIIFISEIKYSKRVSS